MKLFIQSSITHVLYNSAFRNILIDVLKNIQYNRQWKIYYKSKYYDTIRRKQIKKFEFIKEI